MKTLYIVRHAKAEDPHPKIADFDRQLTEHGKEQALQVGKKLSKHATHVDVIVTSPAARALATAQIIAQGIQYPVNKIQEIPEMYEATVDDLLEIISNIEPSYTSAMLVGHNPTISLLAQKLSPDLTADLSTCTIIVITFDRDSWHEIYSMSGILHKTIKPD